MTTKRFDFLLFYIMTMGHILGGNLAYTSQDPMEEASEQKALVIATNLHHKNVDSLRPCPIYQSIYLKTTPEIVMILPQYRSYFKNIMNDLFRKRYDVFKTKLNWDIPTQGDMDIDQYDTDQAVYLVSVDPKYGVCGGLRFLPTTGSYMLKDTFPYLMDKSYKFPCDPEIWESTRFFYDRPRDENDQPGASRQGTVRLIIAEMELMQMLSPKGMVAVTDTKTFNNCVKVGMLLTAITKPVMIANLPTIAIKMESTSEAIADIRKRYNIYGPVQWIPTPYVDKKEIKYNSLESKL